MTPAHFLERIARTGWAERVALAEAVVAIAAASLAIRLLPFRTVSRLASLEAAPLKPSPDVERLRWAVRASAPLLPWKALCFQSGLALHWMLRRRGLVSHLHYGVDQGPARGLTAHVWVSLDGRILIGETEAANHACLAVFPPLAPRA